MPTADADFDFITRPAHTLAAWVALFDARCLPVLASSAQTLEELRGSQDAVDAHLLAEWIADDPLFTLKLLAHVAALRRGREGGEVETVTAALVMLGITPFFSAFGPQPTAEARLAAWPQALQGFQCVLQRARRAARFAMGFAIHRMDHDAPVLHQAALLHDFAEMLLWLHAPALALELQRRQQTDTTLRSAAAQQALLNVQLVDLEHALMQAWGLPALLVQITSQPGPQPTAQMRNVQLAIRVARHSTLNWENPALPDDVREVAQLLNLAPASAAHLLQEIDAD